MCPSPGEIGSSIIDDAKFKYELIERMVRMETLITSLVSDVPSLRERVRKLELGYVALCVIIGGIEFANLVVL